MHCIVTARSLAAIAVFVLLQACGESPTPDRAPGADTAASTATGVPSNANAPETIDTTRTFAPRDPATGTLSLVATGEHAGKWTFEDVNGSINERAGGGMTTVTLQLEAHNDPVHFKIRLTSSSGEFEPGIYTVGNTERGVDATYENASVYYKAFGGSKGTVSLTSMHSDRATGTFDLVLETLEENPRIASVKGTFDMRVQR